MAEENQQKSFSEMTEQEQANYIANLSTKPFERMTSEERNVWLQHLDAENDRLTDQEEIAEEEAERLAEEAEERAEREKEEAEERAEREAEEAERRTEREAAVKAETDASLALQTTEAKAHQQVIANQEARLSSIEALENKLDETEDEATRKQIEAQIEALEKQVEENEDAYEKSRAYIDNLNDKLEDARGDLQDIYSDELANHRREGIGPNFWQRYMPELLGGWSSERVEEWDKAHPQGKRADEGGPNMWQRYMPEELWGWSSEKVEEWDKAHPKPQQQATSQPERSAPKTGEDREVLKGVTVKELREAGYTSEQIHRLDMMSVNATNRARQDARSQGRGLSEHLAASGAIRITEQDYQQAGFNQQDMATIYNLSKNQNS